MTKRNPSRPRAPGSTPRSRPRPVVAAAGALIAFGLLAALPAAAAPQAEGRTTAAVAPVPAPRRAGPAGRAAVPLPLPRPVELDAGEEMGAGASAEAEAGGAPEKASDESGGAVAPLPEPPAAYRGGTAPGGAPAGAAGKPARPGVLAAACAALVEQDAIVATAAADVATKPGCALPDPVRLSAARMADGALVSFEPPAVVRCDLVAPIVAWLKEEVAPALAAQGAPLKAVTVAASYDCRPRNRVFGAKMSEHGFGNAVDVGGFRLADGRRLEVKNAGLPPAFAEAMKASACGRFATVLGPGSDGYHEDHIHVDAAKRRLDFKMCRWVIRNPAEPAAKVAAGRSAPPPAEAAARGIAAPEEAVSVDGSEAADADAPPAAGSAAAIPSTPPARSSAKEAAKEAAKETARPPAASPAAKLPAKPGATKPSATKPSATKPSATKPSATKPVTTKPGAAKPGAAKLPATGAAGPRPEAARPTTAGPGDATAEDDG